MSELVLLYRYKNLLNSRTAVSANDLMASFEVSKVTLKRDIAKLRDQLYVPIKYDRDIMKFGSDVQVLAPPALRTKVQKSFLEAASKYV